ncbi:hypothetical protein [Variovorax sp. PBL-E5]|uniref:hypothetical protein n=1 Tax=Variovorax sp. PBL-E5 TaxID=434014 RepID=UPI0013199BBB|nr:hypothetical protein [Variovorax sp. PBL-E5]VTU29044.1 hypothetical protein E5CHR_02731 [Variovorax sp. PBL-E5]
MPEHSQRRSIPRETAQARVQQSLALTDFFVSVWASNPKLARQAGRKVEEFMMTREEVRRRHLHDLDGNP